MKNLVILIGLVLASLQLAAQSSDLVVFSEMGEKFTLLINGEQINAEPASRVEKRGITQETAKAVLRFEDVSKGIITKNFYFEPDTEYTVNVKLSKKGKYVMRMAGTGPAQQPSSQTASEPIVEHQAVQAPSQSSEQSGSTTVTTTTHTTSNDEINMSVNGAGVSINMTLPGTVSSSEVTTTTTTTSSTTVVESSEQVSQIHEEAVTGNCGMPTTDTEFEDISSAISAKTFEDTKLSIAKEITPNKCLTSKKIKQVLELFTYEESKLDYAKFAYDYCFDPDNYYQIYDAFTFEMSIEELQKHIKSK